MPTIRAVAAACLAAILALPALPRPANAQDGTGWLPDPPERWGFGGSTVCAAGWGGNRIERYVTELSHAGGAKVWETILTTTMSTANYFLFARPTEPDNAARAEILDTAVDLGFGLELSAHVPVRIETTTRDYRVDFFHTADAIYRPSVPGVAGPGETRLMTISAHVDDGLLDSLAASGYLGMVYLGRGPDAEWAMPVDIGDFAAALAKVRDCAGG